MHNKKLDRTAFSIGELNDEGNDKNYWLSKTPQQRLLALEIMREILYGYDQSASRLQRVFEIAERE
ncbi:hypothetical protein JXQ31_04890 [candidate division KSB1 bacterium]|nr:hypothetical protein [candidate division KSB1 bacterium]